MHTRAWTQEARKKYSVQNVRLALLFIYLFKVFTLFAPYITMRPAAPQTALWGGGGGARPAPRDSNPGTV